jgi:hypothetical protein
LDRNKLIALSILLIIVLSPAAYVLYAYHQFSQVVHPGTPKASEGYVVISPPASEGFYVLSESEYREMLARGQKPPEGSRVYNVSVDSYITGSPEVDLNLTIRSVYDSFTIILGDPSVKECTQTPQLYSGNCQYRTAAVSEVTAMIANVFKTNYYIEGLDKGYNNVTAKQYAYNQTWLRYRKTYLTFMTKLSIGRGKLGNQNDLAVLLIGPAEGATANRVFTPRRGLLVIEGKTDDTLRAEIVLVEKLIGFSWPAGSRGQ